MYQPIEPWTKFKYISKNTKFWKGDVDDFISTSRKAIHQASTAIILGSVNGLVPGKLRRQPRWFDSQAHVCVSLSHINLFELMFNL